MNEQKPDVILMSEDQYQYLADQGRLYDLESVIRQDKFDIENMAPAVIELLKAKGGGKLYGLSPTFNSQALFYNKDLFDQYRISYPTDRMSWEDVLKLAARFPTDGKEDARIYGLAQSLTSNNPFDLVRNMALSKGLTYIDPNNTNISVTNEEWSKTMQMAVDGYKAGYIQQPGTGGGGAGAVITGNGAAGGTAGAGGNAARGFGIDTSFISGKAAMVIDNSSMLTFMGVQRNIQNASKLNWEVVSMPVDPSNPDVSNSFSVSQIFGVNAESSNVRAAWELVKYINGNELANIRSKSSTELISRSAYMKDKNGKNLEAFYMLKPNLISTAQLYPRGFTAAFRDITTKSIGEAIAGTKTIPQVLAAIQEQGQEALDTAKLSGLTEQSGGGGNLGGGGQIRQQFITR
jgi:multiple sugar transport system substrate-binding protein